MVENGAPTVSSTTFLAHMLNRQRYSDNLPCFYQLVSVSAAQVRSVRQINRSMGLADSLTISYIENLRLRLERAEALLQQAEQNTTSTEEEPSIIGPGIPLTIEAIRRLTNPFSAPHSDDQFLDIADSFQALSLNTPGDHGFQGKSSAAMLVKVAVDAKAVNASLVPVGNEISPAPIKPWGRHAPIHRRAYSFPDGDLMISLIILYLNNANVFIPLLHRPTFERSVAKQLHLRDDSFASVLLLVCAVGARYSEDPRVSLSAGQLHETAGWKWFNQVELCGHSIHQKPNLYDLQCYCLSAQFLVRTSSPRSCWNLVGFGVRLAQDMGAHRRKIRMPAVTIEEELEKRACWILLLFDAFMSNALGRTTALNLNDVDISLPFECDDEYWRASGPHVVFRQPPNKPSLLAFFNCLLNLNRIIIFTSRTLYSTNRHRVIVGFGEKWEGRIVSELDAALNRWFEAIPPHLVWDPQCQNDIFFDQSAALYCLYHHTRILIYRPFIPAFRISDPTGFPSLDICNNAARACLDIAEIQQRRRPNNPLVFCRSAIFTAGIVLTLNLWGENGPGGLQDMDPERDLSDVRRCIEILKSAQGQWAGCGVFSAVLKQLISSPTAGKRPHSPPDVGPAGHHQNSAQWFDNHPAHVPLTLPMYDAALETPPSQEHMHDTYTPLGLINLSAAAVLEVPAFVGDAEILPSSSYWPRDMAAAARNQQLSRRGSAMDTDNDSTAAM
ncbi:fungal-specific transcription factor domain-containing protein [Mycena sp. CBHHK59/15]|nr:fungal-specific transcription factor domain-containing protein [Mycena sp. CBHHK59/15]